MATDMLIEGYPLTEWVSYVEEALRKALGLATLPAWVTVEGHTPGVVWAYWADEKGERIQTYTTWTIKAMAEDSGYADRVAHHWAGELLRVVFQAEIIRRNAARK